jgi:Right handed beta helix region
MVYSPAKASSPQADSNEFINLKIHDIGRNKYHHGFYINTNHNLIDHCEVWNVYGIGITIYKSGGHNGLNCSDNTIRGCKIHDTGLDRSDVTAGILVAVGDGNLVCNNLIWNNFTGVQIDTGATNSKVYNNTIYKSFGDAGIRNGYPNPPGARHTVIRNNILYQNTNGDKIMNYAPGMVTDHNLIGGLDPKFVNAAGHDFHLQASSPAIDAGATLPEVTTDHEGVRRPQKRAYDIGAYEYVPFATQGQGGGTKTRKR